MTTTATLQSSIVCEVGYSEYDAGGTLLDSRDPGLVLYETYFGDSDPITTCVEVCTVYVTEGVTFTSTYRSGVTAERCEQLRSQYESNGEPYNTNYSTYVHDGWREKEVLEYSSNTTVLCCTEDGCNDQCVNEHPPQLDASGIPGLNFACLCLAATMWLTNRVVRW